MADNNGMAEEPTFHTQIEINGTPVDEGIYLLLSMVWHRGLKTRSSCQGGGPTVYTHLPYIIFPALEDGIEFLAHTATLTDYRYGEGVGLNIIHPMIDLNGPPEAKVAWMPELTIPITNAWGKG